MQKYNLQKILQKKPKSFKISTAISGHATHHLHPAQSSPAFIAINRTLQTIINSPPFHH
jgi:hypothetical protein